MNLKNRDMRNKKEEKLQIAICTYIKLKYPDVIFKSELSGQDTSKTQSKLNKELRSSKGFPDLEILEPNIKYSGLYIELKTSSPFKKNGELKQKLTPIKLKGQTIGHYDHLKGQSEMLLRLNKLGYFAKFAWNFDMAKRIIDNYLKIPKKDVALFSSIGVTEYYKL